MIFLFNKIYNVFCDLFFNNKIWKNQFKKVVTLEFSSDAIIKNRFPVFALVRPCLDSADIDTFLYPTKQGFVCVGNVNANIRQFSDMSFAINNSGNISNFSFGNFRDVKRNITFKCFGLKRISARMGTVFALTYSCLARLRIKYFTTTQTVIGLFGFSIDNFCQTSRRISPAGSRTESFLSLLKWPFALFTSFHKLEYNKWIAIRQ